MPDNYLSVDHEHIISCEWQENAQISTYVHIYIPSSSTIVTTVVSQLSVLLGCEGYSAEMINDLSLVSNKESSFV